MLNSLPVVIVVGTVLGFLTGLGIGGGSLLMVWLTVVLGMEPSTARGINLLFFLPGALTAIVQRRKQGILRWGDVLPAAVAGCAAAAVFSWLSGRMDVALLKKLFGVILMAAGIRELFWKSRRP